jgi:phosphonate transport system permease protein
VLGVILVWSIDTTELSLSRLAAGVPRLADYVLRTAPELRWSSLTADLALWYWGGGRWLRLLVDTVVIALLGTAVGMVAATPTCFLAARNTGGHRAAAFAMRRLFEGARTVPELVFTLIFVYAFGLGALPGVLALGVHSFGALGKLFAEVVENTDGRGAEALRATGAGWAQQMRYGVMPQVLPDLISYGLLRFEINVRAATVLGFVGAGGIGQELLVAVRQFYLTDVSAILLLIIATVMIADVLSGRLRQAVIRVSA